MEKPVGFCCTQREKFNVDPEFPTCTVTSNVKFFRVTPNVEKMGSGVYKRPIYERMMFVMIVCGAFLKNLTSTCCPNFFS